MPDQELTFLETLQMRRSHLGKHCKLHFEVAPLKIVRGSKQYLYDDTGAEYLDCINNASHVGHCHPHVVGAGQEQMGKLTTSQGFLTETMSLYAKRLVETLPESLCVCFFVNSGSEANDLALRLARAYTGNDDVVVVDNSYHGNLGNLIDLSPLKFKKMPNGKKEHVHVVPAPDTYRGKYREDEANPGQKYAREVQKVIQEAHGKNRRVAAYMCEPLMSLNGVLVPPKHYLKLAYRYVHDAGGVCIADEVQGGLGRTGENYWAFQSQDVVPDIVTCGKPLGNGYPMAFVITRRDIADSLQGDFATSFGGNPVSCSIGIAVMDVIQNEKLLSSAKCVGRTLIEGFRNIMPRHPMLGDVRGQGLIVGIDIVTDKDSRKPAKEAAELLSYKMKQEKILIANEGPDKNVMIMLPPMCFTCDNARRVIRAFDTCLSEIESGACPDLLENAQGSVQIETTELNIPLDIVSGSYEDSDDDPDCKRARYEDID